MPNNIALVPILAGSLGIIYLFRKELMTKIWRWKTNKILKYNRKIFIVDREEKWDEINTIVCRDLKRVSALGFDCEWVQINGRRNPVALMQLATYSGICVLIKWNCLQKGIPYSLKKLLEDREIYKVGVSCEMDALYLMQDYNINVRGWMDLRHLENCNLGLRALAKHHLGKTLNKDRKIQLSNWEAPIFTQSQILYAAEDALVGVQILLAQLKTCWKPELHWSSLGFESWKTLTLKAVEEVCRHFVEVGFHQGSSGRSNNNNKSRRENGFTSSKINHLKGDRTAYSIRKSPLYHNSQLWAPDGEPLCTCDPKKAFWYVEKGLGELVSEDPLVVKLNFEPAGRPNREGTDGQFYLQERHNICVVCGKNNSYIRKNIIPHEYRKYFPEILKSHQSHDVVLLCCMCHKVSNIKDIDLRQELAKECDAPIGCETDVKLTMDGRLKSIRSAGGALKKSRSQLPPNRIQVLEDTLREFFQTNTLTDDLITQAAELDTQILNEEYSPHGYKVFKYYEKIGLIKLETRWRKWFLNSMSPKFLPDNWSVSHNHRKLEIKMSRYPCKDEKREDFRVALVGTEGEIDIPYQPNNRIRQSSFYNLDDPVEDLIQGHSLEEDVIH